MGASSGSGYSSAAAMQAQQRIADAIHKPVSPTVAGVSDAPNQALGKVSDPGEIGTSGISPGEIDFVDKLITYGMRMLDEMLETNRVLAMQSTVVQALAFRSLTEADAVPAAHLLPWAPPGPYTLTPVAASDSGAPKADYHGPADKSDPSYEAHKAAHDVTEHLYAGRITNAAARKGLRDALDQADKPPTGRAKADGAIGRALSLGAQDIGLTVTTTR